MAEYIAVKEGNLSFISNDISFEEAAMNEPASVAIHAFKKSQIKPKDTVLIYGIETIGLILAQLARAAGVSETLKDCIENAGNFAKIICLGNPLKEMSLPQNTYWKILRKKLSLIGVWNSCFSEKENDWKDAITALKAGKIDLKSLITHRFSLSDYKKAFEIMKEKKKCIAKLCLR